MLLGVLGSEDPPVREDLALSDRVFFYPGCGWAADHDHNASLNILKVWEPPLEPVELRPLPSFSGQGGALKREAPSSRAG
jgi:transposase